MATTAATNASERDSALDVTRLREEFPVLHQSVRGKPLVYLDNAASSQRPRVVAEAVASYYAEYASNVHRGVHALAERATAAYEGARAGCSVSSAPPDLRGGTTRGTTEAINLVARSFARSRLGPGDEVLITAMEHHSNIVPWQLVCEESGAKLVVVPIDDRGDLIVEEFERLLSTRTKIAAAVWISNALGTVNPVAELVRLAHQNGTPILIDGAQAAPHREIDVRALGCDFFCFSGHKTYAPGGIGALYGRLEHLEAMPPWQGGGDMILSVSFEKTEFNHPPYRFEAGTPNVEGAIGLGAALAWLRGVGLGRIERHERALLERATARVSEIPGVRLIGTAREAACSAPHRRRAPDIGTVLDSEGSAVRAGHHCAQPVMERFGVAATARASFALYNTFAEVDALAEGIGRVQKLFSLS